MQLIEAQDLAPILENLAGYRFTTQEFMVELHRQNPSLYDRLVDQYGAGGKGSGRHYSMRVHIAKSLMRHTGEQHFSFAGYIRAPREWGHRKIALWECKAYPGAETERIANNVVADINAILTDLTLSATTRAQLVLTRIGQGNFRKNLIRMWNICPITGCNDVRLLTASHIKPWSVSTNSERLDPYNGLLLTPNADRLFDKGYVTFQDDGTLLYSSRLSRETIDALCLPLNARIDLRKGHRNYMAYHRDYVFETQS